MEKIVTNIVSVQKQKVIPSPYGPGKKSEFGAGRLTQKDKEFLRCWVWLIVYLY